MNRTVLATVAAALAVTAVDLTTRATGVSHVDSTPTTTRPGVPAVIAPPPTPPPSTGPATSTTRPATTTTRPATTTTRPATTTAYPATTTPVATNQPMVTTSAPPVTTTTAGLPGPPATTTPPVTFGPPASPGVFVRGLEVTQGIQDLQSRMPLVAGRKTTVRVHVGSSFGEASIDGALIVERAGQPDEVLIPDNGAVSTSADRADTDGALNFELEPRHYAAGEVTFTAAVWVTTGSFAVVDASAGATSMTKSVEFLSGRTPTLWLVVAPEADPSAALDVAATIRPAMLESLPAADIHVRIVPWPFAIPPDGAGGLAGRLAWLAELSGLGDHAVIIGQPWNDAASSGDEEEFEIHGIDWSRQVACTEAGAEPGNDALTAPTRPCSLAPVDQDGYFAYTNYSTPPQIVSNDSAGAESAGGLYEFPGAYGQRFDAMDYCRSLDSFGIPCDPAEIGLTAKPPGACDADPVDWAGLHLDLCPTAGAPTLPAQEPDLIEEQTGFVYETIRLPSDPDGWLIVSTSTDHEARATSIAQTQPSDALSPALADRFAATIEGVVDGTVTADVALRLVSADGTPLVVVPLDSPYHQVALTEVAISHVDVTVDASAPALGPAVGYLVPIPWADGAVAIEVIAAADGAVIDHRPIDAAPPRVGGVRTETVGAAQSLSVSWEGDAPGAGTDGADTAYTVLWSNDGETWLPAAVGVSGKEVTLKNTSYFPAGDNVQIQVIASDGFRSSSAVSEQFSVPFRPPLVAIAGAPHGPVEQFDRIELSAIVFDPDDSAASSSGIDQADYSVWRSNLGGPIFDGRLLSARDLAVGTHTIELIVTDSDGNEASAEIEIDVMARTSPTRYTETPDATLVEYINQFQAIPDDESDPPTQANLPGGQSCGSNECVGDFIAACEEAGGLAVDVGPDPPSPDGVEVECQQNSSQPD